MQPDLSIFAINHLVTLVERCAIFFCLILFRRQNYFKNCAHFVKLYKLLLFSWIFPHYLTSLIPYNDDVCLWVFCRCRMLNWLIKVHLLVTTITNNYYRKTGIGHFRLPDYSFEVISVLSILRTFDFATFTAQNFFPSKYVFSFLKEGR